MTQTPDVPQIYLITPPAVELSVFPDLLGACLDKVPVSCVRLALGTRDEVAIAKAADALRDVCHSRDVAIVIEAHLQLVTRLGLDGVHLSDAARSVKLVRKELGDDAIVGSFCGQSRHDAMTAAELGVDYVSFGPVGTTPLGDGRTAGIDLFSWWSEMIEIPVVAEGALDAELIGQIAPFTDYFGIGDEVWRSDDPAMALAALHKIMIG